MRGVVCLASAIISLALLVVPSATVAAPDGISFRDVSFQLPGDGWQRVDSPATPGIAPSFITFTRVQDQHKLAGSLFEIQAGTDAQRVGQDELAATIFDSIRQSDLADIAQVRGAHRQELPDTARTIAGTTYPVSRSHVTVDGSVSVTEGLYLLYFPADFTERRRLLELAWIDTHPASVQASDITGFDGMVTSLIFRPLRGVLVSDDFSDANTGVFPNTPPNPPAYQRGYVDGDYMVRVENVEVVASVATKDEYSDATVAVDAHTAEDTPQAQVWLYCRRSGNLPSGYRFRVEPATQRFAVDRIDKAQATILLSFQSADVINSGSDTNHLELTCAGSTIAGSINNQQVFSLQDATYSQGTFNIGASGPPSSAGEIRFANFAVLQA
jgi:hypothetical protein